MKTIQQRGDITSEASQNPSAKVNIRCAIPADLDSLVVLHMNSFERDEHLAVRFGRAYIRKTYEWFVTAPETFTIVATHGGKLVGLTTVCDTAYNGVLFRRTIIAVFVGMLRHPSVAFSGELLKRLFRLIAGKTEAGQDHAGEVGVSHLAFIAVDASMRGKGVGVALLEEAKRISRGRGSTKMRAGVYKQNIASIKMFAKAQYHIIPNLDTPRTHFVEADLN